MRKKRPPEVERAIFFNDKPLLSAMGKMGGKRSGIVRRRKRDLAFFLQHELLADMQDTANQRHDELIDDL